MTGDTSTLRWELRGPTERTDWLVAELAEAGFDAFEEVPTGLIAYRPPGPWSDGERAAVEAAVAGVGFCLEEETQIEQQNWNANWESGIEAINAGPFCVHPPWREPTAGLMPICIEPKMSFGTAHHATTRLMLRAMPDVVSAGDRVLDAGTGTGVLAIAALRLGAEEAVGFDIDPWSRENAEENVTRNGGGKARVHLGGLDVVGEAPFDVILANINRSALEGMLQGFQERLSPDGSLLLSGILQQDESRMTEALSRVGLQAVSVLVEDEWIAMTAQRASEQ